MVVFTCNNCGDSLQKPRVAKHYQFQCRNSISLTCVDCFKDFLGDEYVAHTKCVTEAERYGGKDYKAKASANKGERKQQAWINVVQNVLANAPDLTHPERLFLQSISRHENIPRKKAKFLNFVKNAVGNRANMSVVDSCWTKMESAFKEATEKDKPDEQKPINQTETSICETSMSEENNVAENENNENICRENGDLSINKENTSENEPENLTNGKQKKKKAKKRELEKLEPSEEQNGEPSPKKRNPEVSEPSKETAVETKTGKFCWKSTIFEVLGDKEEISMKKLRKKVVGRYLQHVGDSVTREKAVSRFEKKLNKMAELVLTDDKVTRI